MSRGVKMDYYVETNFFDHDGLVTSGGKGRDDFFEMLRLCGLRCIRIPVLKDRLDVSFVQRIALEYRLRREWVRALKDLGSGDVLVVHHPPSEKFMAMPAVLRSLRKRGCIVATIVFDLESYLTPYYRTAGRIKYFLSMLTEKRMLDVSDCMMVHNERMKELVVSRGYEPGRINTYVVMDYLRDDEPDEDDIRRRTGKDKPLVFCGNLVEGKSGFLKDFPDDLSLDLYGPGYSGGAGENINYKGVFPSLELMNIFSGSFGLVWDGDSSLAATGVTGEYLRYNNPHKIAFYLAGGLPVIVWKESAMADVVRRERCGIAVDDLTCIKGVLAAMSDDEYEEMRANAIRTGRGMRRGEHLRTAINGLLDMAHSQTRRPAGPMTD